jgi:hypothetical protein
VNSLIEDWKARKAEEDVELHDRLVSAIRAGQVQVFTDPRMLGHDASPLHSPWDQLAPLLILMTLALVVLLSAGVAIGIVAMTLGALLHLTCNRYFVDWRLRNRAVGFITTSLTYWQTIWQIGGIALVVAGTNEPACFAPLGDWRKFARRNLGAEGGVPAAPVPVPVRAKVAPPPPVAQPQPEPEIQPPPPPPPPPPAEPTIGDVIDHAPLGEPMAADPSDHHRHEA